eukprot:scaffold36635_cov63-Phaeocystis_antarctica.AAC.1
MRASQGAATQHPAACRRLTRYGVFVSMLVATVDAMPSCVCGTVSVVLDGSAHDARSGQAGEYQNGRRCAGRASRVQTPADRPGRLPLSGQQQRSGLSGRITPAAQPTCRARATSVRCALRTYEDAGS